MSLRIHQSRIAEWCYQVSLHSLLELRIRARFSVWEQACFSHRSEHGNVNRGSKAMGWTWEELSSHSGGWTFKVELVVELVKFS